MDFPAVTTSAKEPEHEGWYQSGGSHLCEKLPAGSRWIGHHALLLWCSRQSRTQPEPTTDGPGTRGGHWHSHPSTGWASWRGVVSDWQRVMPHFGGLYVVCLRQRTRD